MISNSDLISCFSFIIRHLSIISLRSFNGYVKRIADFHADSLISWCVFYTVFTNELLGSVGIHLINTNDAGGKRDSQTQGFSVFKFESDCDLISTSIRIEFILRRALI